MFVVISERSVHGVSKVRGSRLYFLSLLSCWRIVEGLNYEIFESWPVLVHFSGSVSICFGIDERITSIT